MIKIEFPFRTEEEWNSIERHFATRWNYSNCIGCIDGKHIQMVKPPNSGSVYYNYKKTFSISLLAVVTADYRFIAYDVGRPGRMSDAGIWLRSQLRRHFEPTDQYNPLNIPKAEKLADHTGRVDTNGPKIPYHIVGDDGFGLSSSLIKPYNKVMDAMKDVFNYRLSRTRQTVEVAFGILANRFRVLHNRVHCLPKNAQLIVESCLILHNFLSTKRPITSKCDIERAKSYYPLLNQLPNQRKPRDGPASLSSALEIRDYIKEYFVTTYPIRMQYDNL